MTQPNQVARWALGGTCPTVVATCAINGLAFNPYQTWALRRAEQTAFSRSPFLSPNANHVTMAHVTTLPHDAIGADRLLPLLRAGLQQLVPDPRQLENARHVGVYLCLPERMQRHEPGMPSAIPQRDRILRELAVDVARLSPKATLYPWPGGHASGADALREAGSALQTGNVDLAIVLGVDSYYDPEVVQFLIDTGRAFDGDNTDALIAGEGVAGLLLTTRAVAASQRWPALAHVEAAVSANEPATPFNDVPCDGTALSSAARDAVSALIEAGRALDIWLTDLTGEELRSHELQLAWPRFAHACMGPTSRMEHLPEHLGDLGAATLPTMIAVACEMFRREDVSTCLSTGASPGGGRGVVLLSGPRT